CCPPPMPARSLGQVAPCCWLLPSCGASCTPVSSPGCPAEDFCGACCLAPLYGWERPSFCLSWALSTQWKPRRSPVSSGSLGKAPGASSSPSWRTSVSAPLWPPCCMYRPGACEQGTLAAASNHHSNYLLKG